MRRSRSTPPWLSLSLLFVLFFALPLTGLVWRATTDGNVGDALTSSRTLEALRLSLATATLTTVLAVVLSTPLAYLLASRPNAASRLLATLLELPLVLPPAVAGIALLTAFGRMGILGTPLAEAGVSLSFTTAAVVMAQLFVAAPYFLRAAYGGFASTDPRFEAVAATLGLSPWRVFRDVALPLARPALVGGVILCWARALGELGATLLFAGSLPGRTQTMPLAIISAFESPDGLAGAVSISVVLLAFAAVLLVALNWLARARGPYG